LPPAPGLFSMTKVHFALSETLFASVRAEMSVPPPGGKGTMSLIGLAG
jgi:hypothetical protein